MLNSISVNTFVSRLRKGDTRHLYISSEPAEMQIGGRSQGKKRSRKGL